MGKLDMGGKIQVSTGLGIDQARDQLESEQKAFDVVRRVNAGGDITTEELIDAAKNLINRNRPGMSQIDELSHNASAFELIYERLPSEAGRAELLGALITKGRETSKLTRNLLHNNPPKEFSAQEIDILDNLIGEPLYEIMVPLVTMLGLIKGDSADSSGRDKGPTKSYRGARQYSIREEHDHLEDGPIETIDNLGDGGDGGLGPLPDPIQSSSNSTAKNYEIKHFESAVQRGIAGLPDLVKTIKTGDATDLEWAIPAFQKIARSADTTMSIAPFLMDLQMNPEYREWGEYLSAQIFGKKLEKNAGLANSGGEKDDAHGATWLIRALDACDKPSVLGASTGIEHLAIPLTMRRIVTIRQK